MDIIKVFGDNLKKYRTAMGISQEAFAEKVWHASHLYKRHRMLPSQYFA